MQQLEACEVMGDGEAKGTHVVTLSRSPVHPGSISNSKRAGGSRSAHAQLSDHQEKSVHQANQNMRQRERPHDLHAK